MQFKPAAAKRKRAMSIVPLIDIVFILLLFFMLSTSLIKGRELRVDFPKLDVNPSDTVIRVLRLETEGGIVAYGDQLIDTSEPHALKVLVDDEEQVVYAIDTARGISTQALVTLLDRLKLVGIENVSIIEN